MLVIFFLFFVPYLEPEKQFLVLSFKTTVELCHPTLHSVSVSVTVSVEWTDTMASNVG